MSNAKVFSAIVTFIVCCGLIIALILAPRRHYDDDTVLKTDITENFKDEMVFECEELQILAEYNGVEFVGGIAYFGGQKYPINISVDQETLLLTVDFIDEFFCINSWTLFSGSYEVADDKIIVKNISLPVNHHKNAPKLHAWYEGKSITLQTSNKSFNTKNNTADKLFGLCECGYTLESHTYYSEKLAYIPENASMVKQYAVGEKNIGEIANEEYLIEQAKKLWDKDLLNKLVVDNINEECPVVAQYNENDEVWYVIQTANPNTDGVFPLAIIKSNGDVVLTALY